MTPLALLMDFLTVLVALALVLGLAFFSIRMLKKVQSGAPSGDEIRFIRSTRCCCWASRRAGSPFWTAAPARPKKSPRTPLALRLRGPRQRPSPPAFRRACAAG